jgi:hypothetical protein
MLCGGAPLNLADWQMSDSLNRELASSIERHRLAFARFEATKEDEEAALLGASRVEDEARRAMHDG